MNPKKLLLELWVKVMNSIKIISDGTPNGTKVIDLETGKIIHWVQEVTWRIDTDNLAQVTIKVLNVPVELTSNKVITLLESYNKGSITNSKIAGLIENENL